MIRYLYSPISLHDVQHSIFCVKCFVLQTGKFTIFNRCLGSVSEPNGSVTVPVFFIFFWPQVEVSPSTLRFTVPFYYTMTLQRPRINEGDAGFEPGTSASEVWRATNEPPHLTDPTHVTPYYMDPKQVMEI